MVEKREGWREKEERRKRELFPKPRERKG